MPKSTALGITAEITAETCTKENKKINRLLLTLSQTLQPHYTFPSDGMEVVITEPLARATSFQGKYISKNQIFT